MIKNPSANTGDAGDAGSILGLKRSPGGGNGNPFQYSYQDNPMDCIVIGVAKSRTRLSDFHFTSLHFKKGKLRLFL